MPRHDSKRIIIEVHPITHEVVKKQAKEYNKTIREHVLDILLPEIRKREKVLKGD